MASLSTSSRPSLARSERAALCDLFDAVGPDVPTLCAGWRSCDLAAHLVVRERRPDAAAGIGFAPLASYTAKVQGSYAARPWPELVGLVRGGPPPWSYSYARPVGDAVNGIEFFVHHEDVRRARPDWTARDLPAADQDELWSKVKLAGKLFFARAGTGVLLRRPDGTLSRARGGSSYVTLTGEPGELVLYAFGRRDQAQVEVTGEDADRTAFAARPGGPRG